jgi:prepilin-type N-terminal cleavage/methylation domain-containing protein
MKNGFTLVEMVVASVLLLLAVGALLFGFVQSQRATKTAQKERSALRIARNQIERLQVSNYYLVKSYTNVQDGYRVEVSVWSNRFMTNPLGVSAVKDINVIVRWSPPKSSRTSAVALSASVSEELHQ